MTLRKLQHQVHIDEYPEGMDQVFAEAINENTAYGTAIIDTTWLNDINSQYQLYKKEKI